MSDPVITVENLGKKYRIRHQHQRQRYLTFRDLLADKTKRAARRLWSAARRPLTSDLRPQTSTPPAHEDFWALRGVSFEVNQGESLGIIGSNGAGKSTLLKILSRITEPTVGRARITGRVASLIEVGTGFHPELTGRENIFLNGSILGMSRAEIQRKFDEIIAFAEVEKFLDTPVKHYSSGMYVRLAFAVAAHLEQEILVVDEVLAVGDAQFQKKCLGKMREVGLHQGRTVLFVSHNIQAVKLLCSRSVLLKEGNLLAQGPTEEVTRCYLAENETTGAERVWPREAAPGDATLRLLSLKVAAGNGTTSSELCSDEYVFVEMLVEISSLNDALRVGFELLRADGTVLLTSFHNDTATSEWPPLSLGSNNLRCQVPPGLLNAGRYTVAPRICIHCVRWIVYEPPTVEFDVRITHGRSHFWMGNAPHPGAIRPVFHWVRR
jgi:lipopolysaccharide transport system ATP-binding protein